MSDRVRAKFHCQEVAFSGDPDNENTPRIYTFRAVWDPELAAENRSFSKATPWGELKIAINNPSAYPKVGKSYYLDFTEAQ